MRVRAPIKCVGIALFRESRDGWQPDCRGDRWNLTGSFPSYWEYSKCRSADARCLLEDRGHSSDITTFPPHFQNASSPSIKKPMTTLLLPHLPTVNSPSNIPPDQSIRLPSHLQLLPAIRTVPLRPPRRQLSQAHTLQMEPLSLTGLDSLLSLYRPTLVITGNHSPP